MPNRSKLDLSDLENDLYSDSIRLAEEETNLKKKHIKDFCETPYRKKKIKTKKND